MGDLNHKCQALADLLGFDFTLNYGTYVSDTTGYFYTLSDVTLDIANKYIIPASSYIPESDAVTLHAILSRDMIPTFESQFNLRVTEPNDTMTKIGIAMPITFRIDLPPLVNNHTLPLGYNVFPVPEVALGARTSLALGKPVLTLIDSKPPTPILPPRERLYLSMTLDNLSIRNFSTWSIQVLIATQPALNRTMFPDLVKNIRVQVHDTAKDMDLFDRFPQPLVSPDTRAALANAKASDTVTFPVQAFDRTWSVRCSGTGSLSVARSYIMLAILLLAFVLIAEGIRRASAQAFKQRWMSTQMNQHELMVNAAHKYAQAIVQAFPDPLFVLDQAGYLVGSNQVALSRFGQTSRQDSQCVGPVHVSEVIRCELFTASAIVAQPVTDTVTLPPLAVKTNTAQPATWHPLEPGVHKLGWIRSGGHDSAKSLLVEAVVSPPVAVSGSPSQIVSRPRRSKESNWGGNRTSRKYKQVLIVHDITEYMKALAQCERAAQDSHGRHMTAAAMLKTLLDEIGPRLHMLNKSSHFAESTAYRVPFARLQANCARITRLTLDILSNASIIARSRWQLDQSGCDPAIFPVYSPPLFPRISSYHTPSVQYPWIHPSAIIQQSIDAMQPLCDSRQVIIKFVTSSSSTAVSGPITASVTVSIALQKLVQISVYATKAGGCACLELAVDPRSRTLRVRCRGDMRVPTMSRPRLASRVPVLWPRCIGDCDERVRVADSLAEMLQCGLVQAAGVAVEMLVAPCGHSGPRHIRARGSREVGCFSWVSGAEGSRDGRTSESATQAAPSRGGFDFVFRLGEADMFEM
ncbi:hypothetical protein BCR44DRAFT_1116371 [Catenaria anguillulae PL171]|uniref:Uncharacterized protein n=1 Tax=Catenaria anguillulae PL171 TaxID=765915 RepID=A0A1Y2HPG2_9FUNG|nr:hypothetical protein BCR44DRAFT_1116371 [Catenaria anguillulae PL171]